MNDLHFRDFSTRIQNIAPQYFLVRQAANYEPYYPQYDNLYTLTLWVLLYIYEGMVAGEFKSTQMLAADMTERFIKVYNRHLTSEEAAQLVRLLLFTIIQNDGRPYEYTAVDPVTGEKITAPVRLVQVESFSDSQSYTEFSLTSQGLWLLYATKEIPNELQITIEQLYLKQQYEAGYYEQSLQHLQNIILLIRQVRAHAGEQHQKLRSDAFSVDFETYERLIARREDLNKKEQKEFQILRKKILEDRRILENKASANGEADPTLNVLEELNRRLKRAISDHEELFSATLSLRQAFIDSRRQHIALALNRQPNYERDVLQPLLHYDAPLASAFQGLYFLFRSRQVLQAPAKGAPRFRHFNPLWCFQEQYLRNQETYLPSSTDELEIDEAADAAERERVRGEISKVSRMMQELLVFAYRKNRTSLSAYWSELTPDRQSELSADFQFYNLWGVLYSYGLLDLHKLLEDDADAVYDEPQSVDHLRLVIEFVKQLPPADRPHYLLCIGSNQAFAISPEEEITDYEIVFTNAPLEGVDA